MVVFSAVTIWSYTAASEPRQSADRPAATHSGVEVLMWAGAGAGRPEAAAIGPASAKGAFPNAHRKDYARA